MKKDPVKNEIIRLGDLQSIICRHKIEKQAYIEKTILVLGNPWRHM